jgi:DNA-binding transcriptional ArsR family regulator
MEISKRKINAYKLDKVASIFSALAHPIRLEILEFLEDGNEYTVGEILEYMKIDPTLLTHHLTKMRHVGIVESTKEGRNIYYKLSLSEITNVFDCIQNCKI